MRTAPTPSPQQTCENILIDDKTYNVEHNILLSENAIIDCLLARRLELNEAYGELYDKLHLHPRALPAFLSLLLSTAAFWAPDKIARARGQRDELVDTNQQIAQKAEELAQLLEHRSNLHNTSGFSSDTHYHICNVIEDAAKDHYLFNAYVKERLNTVRNQFEWKYWPTVEQFVRSLGRDANGAELEATDPLTRAATAATRHSPADFFKALFAAIEENSEQSGGPLPEGFRLSDATLASLVNCALDLGPDELKDSAYVKRLRQRERNSDK
ncbi:hypothetical protein [Pseudomonas aeruginosa]|uniref:hypothetical protein n=1 Tax=Pseudomonas aeruginosa TaxID=287 RepID=UPI002044BE7F|nr:hypothetical protein [Pseudomonas aeruginosa]MCM3889046.1 hypothetical protein [Pseudomonas aeruginosa]MCM3939782.1 hypothetical protein [Pseudomonas aeruginosa]MCM3952126.1 hypothetical protein [Pseudomonas aeruginosa]MCM3957836.1 hypothetical protein [Pseudomonas aeruginosa]MCM3963900.1 hypothetical protein [Pseudomonas aeruginosa]